MVKLLPGASFKTQKMAPRLKRRKGAEYLCYNIITPLPQAVASSAGGATAGVSGVAGSGVNGFSKHFFCATWLRLWLKSSA
jgi:hypothetical protein